MSDGTKIEWSDATWNVVTGCTKVSPGCDHCYIERTVPFRIARRSFNAPSVGGTTGVQLHWDRIGKPYEWRTPRMIFVNSLSDLFHQDVPDDLIARVFATMMETPQHTYQILTKRHDRMRSLLRKWSPVTGTPPWTFTGPWPLPNVWLGVSVEDQQRADLRIPALLGTPAAVRFLSCEPLLGAVDLHGPLVDGHRPRLTYWLTGRPDWNSDGHIQVGPRIDWVIVGGESGPGARPMHPDWARAVRDQCVEADVPFFFKQFGEWAPSVDLDPDVRERTREEALAGDEYVSRVGKKRAGRDLDGRTWDQMPEVAR
jgi:protein gp37